MKYVEGPYSTFSQVPVFEVEADYPKEANLPPLTQNGEGELDNTINFYPESKVIVDDEPLTLITDKNLEDYIKEDVLKNSIFQKISKYFSQKKRKL